MNEFLEATDVIDWRHPAILDQAKQLAAGHSGKTAIAKACFEWVRDEIRHSSDYKLNPITWKASDVLRYKTGYCFAKSHLLAALLRANAIPAGFCYQRLSIDDQGAPYSLHGFNGIYLENHGWYRVDARGNRVDVNAQFKPPKEQLAFRLKYPDEVDFETILPIPLPIVVTCLKSHKTWQDILENLPDITLNQATNLGLTPTKK